MPKVWYDCEILARFLFPPESLLCPLFASQRKETALEESRAPSSFSMSYTYFWYYFQCHTHFFDIILSVKQLFDIIFNVIHLLLISFSVSSNYFDIIFNVTPLFLVSFSISFIHLFSTSSLMSQTYFWHHCQCVAPVSQCDTPIVNILFNVKRWIF